MVKEGYVAVAVDNAAAGEASDLECYDKGWNYDYDVDVYKRQRLVTGCDGIFRHGDGCE